MKLTDILDRESVLSSLRSTDKHGVLEELAKLVAERSGGRVSAGDLHLRLLEREKDRPTGIGSGVAVPHGRTSGIDQLIVVFGRSRPGVDFGAIDHQPCHLFFALASPEDQPGAHLRVLARIAHLLRSDAFRRKLLDADDGDAIYGLIRDEDARV